MGWINKKTDAGIIKYYRLTKTVGHKLNAAGNEIPVKKEFIGRTKKEAEAKRNRYMEKRKAGVESSNQYFGILADGWIKEFFIPDRNLKDSTKSMYIRYWNKHIKPLDLYSMPLEDVTAKTLQSVYNKLKKSGVPSSTINKINKLMRRFYSYLESESYSRDITRSLSIPKDEKKTTEEKNVVVWSDSEAKKILKGFDQADARFRMRFFIVLAYYTGCRIGELLALTYDDITKDGLKINKQLGETMDFDENGKMISGYAITSPKSAKSVRTIPLNPIVLRELEIHKAWHKKEMLANGYRTKYVFTASNGEFYYQRNIRRALKRYYDRIGVEEKGVHTYRHTFGTNLCKKGVPIQTASALLGHEDINTTARYYVNVSEAEKQKAVNKLMIAT